MTADAPATTHLGEIYFAMAPHALYVTRGWTEAAPLSLAEWLAAVSARADLQLSELYERHNVDRGITETWRELGRARWAELPDDEYLHFAPAGIRYLHGPTYRGGPAAARWQELRRALGDAPTLPDWLGHVAGDRFLELDDLPGSPERGRVRWVDRQGATKHIFRYQPASVWLYRREDASATTPPQGPPESARLRLARSLARELDATVLDGADHFRLVPSRSLPVLH